MDRQKLQAYIEENYGIAGAYLFARDPGCCVFRHQSNGKWFAIIMDIPREKLGIPGGGNIDIVNFKCDPRLIGSFRGDKGIFPAYHMNKTHWLTVALDNTVEEDKMLFLLDVSYDLTRGKNESNKVKL